MQSELIRQELEHLPLRPAHVVAADVGGEGGCDTGSGGATGSCCSGGVQLDPRRPRASGRPPPRGRERSQKQQAAAAATPTPRNLCTPGAASKEAMAGAAQLYW